MPTSQEYIAVNQDSESSLIGSWLHHFEPQQAGGLDTYQFRFEDSTYLMVSIGMMDSGAGHFYRGTYQLGADGIITATLQESLEPVSEEDGISQAEPPAFEIQFSTAWLSEKHDELHIELLEVGAGGETFASQFAGLLNAAYDYYRY